MSTDVVVPLFREEGHVERLADRLRSVLPLLPDGEILLVDDGSPDRTAERCEELLSEGRFGPRARLLRHHRNLGLSAALRTGYAASRAEILCWLDADLSYDPLVLPRLVRAIEEGAELALSSPWHPDGRDEQVPSYRVVLSKGLSTLYRLLKERDLHTWSSMVRAWRRDLLTRCLPQREGHLGVTESLLRAQERGARIVEIPAKLAWDGQRSSGMRVTRSIFGQLALMRDAVVSGLPRTREGAQ